MAVVTTASSAGAATTVGQTFSPVPGFLPGSTKLIFQSATSDQPSNVIPAAGIITSFSHVAEASPSSTLALVVLRPAGSDYSVIAVSDAKTLTGSAMNTFSVRIPVQAGDLIGMLPSIGTIGAFSSAPPGNKFKFGNALPIADSNILSIGLSEPTGYVVDLSAKVEADADADGYGDETQDQCPTQATAQGPCDLTAPSLTFNAAKTQKSNTGFSFSATGNEAGTLTVDGKLNYIVKKNGRKLKKSFKLTSVSQTLTAGVSSKFSFKLSAKARKALKKAGKMTAALTFTTRAVLGNTATQTLSLTIKPKSK